VQVIGILSAFELRSSQTEEDMRRHVRNKKYNFPVAIDENRIKTFRAYRCRGTPYVAILDPEGKIRRTGFYRPEKVKAFVQSLVEKLNLPGEED